MNNPKVVQLRRLKPGQMFRRDPGEYKYVVSPLRKDGEIYCFNLDGESDGYWHPNDERVLQLSCSVAGIYPKLKPEPDTFYMCYVEGGGLPTHKHTTEPEANGESERLARITGKRVFILKAVSCVNYNPPTDSLFIWTNL